MLEMRGPGGGRAKRVAMSAFAGQLCLKVTLAMLMLGVASSQQYLPSVSSSSRQANVDKLRNRAQAPAGLQVPPPYSNQHHQQQQAAPPPQRSAAATQLPPNWVVDDPNASDDPFRLITKRQSIGGQHHDGSSGHFTSASQPLNALQALQARAQSQPTTSPLPPPPTTTTTTTQTSKLARRRRSEDVCADRLCYGLPMGCLDQTPATRDDAVRLDSGGSLCTVLVTSKHLIDPYRPVARDIHFELVGLPAQGGASSSYAAVGFSESGRMAGLVSECLHMRNSDSHLHTVKLAHSYNVPGAYNNVPVTILSGIRNLGVVFENGYYTCRWVVESAVEFTYEDVNGTSVQLRADLGYKNHHILLATGDYNEAANYKSIHSDRIGSSQPISLAQTNGQIQSLGAHLLIRIHGSLMIAIWLGLVTLSVILARYYKNEWSNSKINELAIWFVLHRALMLIAWFGSLIAVIFAYMYTETYHAGLHQLAGSACLVLSTIQVLGGILRPSNKSDKRAYFNWAHFICGNLAYLFAMVSIITAAFLAPAHLPPIYIWVVVAFVAVYALTHLLMTVHQYISHKSSKISITPMSDLNDTNSSTATYSSCGFVADSYPKETNSTFRQVMLGILVTIVIIFIVLLITLVNIK